MNLHEALKRLKAGEIPDCCYGICKNLYDLDKPAFMDNKDLLLRLFEQWPKYSGVKGYPVPDPEGVNEPGYVYRIADNVWEGPYGDLRKELLDFLIERTKP